jgi:hypothetical protein
MTDPMSLTSSTHKPLSVLYVTTAPLQYIREGV